jgi:hypothetical protein
MQGESGVDFVVLLYLGYWNLRGLPGKKENI